MALVLEPYVLQRERWPRTGCVILAQFDQESVVVYQAFRPEIGESAARHKRFGGRFSLQRMTWIKPNFLWMMYRSDWGRRENQEVVLAVRLRREAFDQILAEAVPSHHVPELYPLEQDWKAAVVRSDVRLQWDPDHGPRGGKLERRAIQLGLRRQAVRLYVTDWILDIEDVSGLVAEQRVHADAGEDARLSTPREEVYPVDPEVAKRLGIAVEGG